MGFWPQRSAAKEFYALSCLLAAVKAIRTSLGIRLSSWHPWQLTSVATRVTTMKIINFRSYQNRKKNIIPFPNYKNHESKTKKRKFYIYRLPRKNSYQKFIS